MEEFNNYIKPDSFIVYMDQKVSTEELTAIEGINDVETLENNKYRFHFEG
jgi:ABC-2 type transport system ATP-binding protein